MAPAFCNASRSHVRALRAFVSVSSVVKVLETTIKSVVSGSRPRVFSTKSEGSILDTKRAVMSVSAYGRSASYTITGPKSEPPIPILTMVFIDFPVMPFHLPERTRSQKAYILSSVRRTSATVSWPSTTNVPIWSAGRRSAVCKTARSSVVLTCFPLYISARRSSRPTSRASSHSS